MKVEAPRGTHDVLAKDWPHWGRIVAKAADAGLALHKLPLGDMQAIEPRITADVMDVLSVEASVASRRSYGGTAPENVREQAQGWLKRLEKEQNPA